MLQIRMRTSRILKLVFTIFLLTLFLGIIGYEIAEFNISYNINDSVQIQSAKYIVYKSGTTYYAKSGETGRIVYRGSNAAAVIQLAINGLTSGRTSKEKILLQGDFTLTATIKMESYMILELDGKVTLGNSAGVNMLTATSKTNFEIKGGEWDGNRANQGTLVFEGLKIISCTDFAVEGVTVHDVKGNNISIISASRATVTNCVSYNADGSGIGLVFTSDSKATNNTVHHCSSGIYLFCEADGVIQRCERNTISGNLVYVISHDGISLYPEGGEDIIQWNTITNNTTYDCGIDGEHVGIAIGWNGGPRIPEVGSVHYNNCTDNLIYYTGAYVCDIGMLVKGTNNTVARNIINNTYASAMFIIGENNIIQDNSIAKTRNLGSFGIGLYLANNTYVKENSLLNIYNDAIWISTNSNNNKIENNYVDTAGGYWLVIDAADCDNNIVYKNFYYNTKGILDNGSNTIYMP